MDLARGGRTRAGIETGPVICLHATLSRQVWRIGPAWAVIAGVLAGGLPALSGDFLLRLVGGIVLADSAWGLLWRLVSGDTGPELPEDSPATRLPYAHSAAPLGTALRRMQRMSSVAAWHELPMALALTAGLSLLLGGAASMVSLAAVLAVLVAWLAAERGERLALPYALLGVAFPWLLGTTFSASGPAGLAGARLPSLALAAAFTILQWGVQRAVMDGYRHTGMLWLGQVAVVTVLVLLRQPWVLAVVVLLLMPPSWWLTVSRNEPADRSAALGRSAAWWWLAMFVAVAQT